MKQGDLEVKFRQGVFLADGHFHQGEDFDLVKFYVPSREKATPAVEEDDPEVELLTKWEKTRNRAIRRARTRLELAIGNIKQPWKALQTPWAEE